MSQKMRCFNTFAEAIYFIHFQFVDQYPGFNSPLRVNSTKIVPQILFRG